MGKSGFGAAEKIREWDCGWLLPGEAIGKPLYFVLVWSLESCVCTCWRPIGTLVVVTILLRFVLLFAQRQSLLDGIHSLV